VKEFSVQNQHPTTLPPNVTGAYFYGVSRTMLRASQRKSWNATYTTIEIWMERKAH